MNAMNGVYRAERITGRTKAETAWRFATCGKSLTSKYITEPRMAAPRTAITAFRSLLADSYSGLASEKATKPDKNTTRGTKASSTGKGKVYVPTRYSITNTSLKLSATKPLSLWGDSENLVTWKSEKTATEKNQIKLPLSRLESHKPKRDSP